jgi:hypothetical protein
LAYVRPPKYRNIAPDVTATAMNRKLIRENATPLRSSTILPLPQVYIKVASFDKVSTWNTESQD